MSVRASRRGDGANAVRCAPIAFGAILGMAFAAVVGPAWSKGPHTQLDRAVVFEWSRPYGYRIPALAVSPRGTILAFSERRIGLADHAQNDIVLRRSEDGGKTWQPEQVLVDEGSDSLNDPCVIVLTSGRILLRYTRFPQGVHTYQSKEMQIAEPGYGGAKNVRMYLIWSDDDGRTWSAPREVTRQMRRETAIAVGSPGTGLQLSRGSHSGRIIFPNYEFHPVGNGRTRTLNSISYSDDGGKTWQLSGPIDNGPDPGYGGEAQIVELADGSILMSARSEGSSQPYRRLTISRDGGVTWSPERFAEDLMTPPCMSSVVRQRLPNKHQPGLLVHSLPHTRRSRSNGTLFVSRDEGRTWKKLRVIEPNDFAYSCLARLPNGDIGCLYETDRYRKIVYMRIPRAWFEQP